MSGLENNGWNEWSKYVLKELEKLGEICDSLADEINGLNVELTKISGIKHSINDLKDWKTSVEEATNLNDLQSLKAFYINNKDVQQSLESIKETLKKYEEQLDDYKKFKTKVYAIAGVLSFLLATGLTVMRIFY
jgi:cell shape-determining protein MreC